MLEKKEEEEDKIEKTISVIHYQYLHLLFIHGLSCFGLHIQSLPELITN